MHEPIDLSEEGNLELTIRFNNVKYRSWKDARDAFHKLKNRKAQHSVWSRLNLVLDDEADTDGPFKLQCIECGKSCQLANPAKWNKEHSCKGPRFSSGMHILTYFMALRRVTSAITYWNTSWTSGIAGLNQAFGRRWKNKVNLGLGTCLSSSV
jgi:hypothetical protein